MVWCACVCGGKQRMAMTAWRENGCELAAMTTWALTAVLCIRCRSRSPAAPAACCHADVQPTRNSTHTSTHNTNTNQSNQVMMRHALGMRATMAAAATASTAMRSTQILAHSPLPSLSAFMTRTFSSESSVEGSAPVAATTVAATPAVAAPAASSPSGSTAPSRRRQRAWADQSTMMLLKDRGIVRKRGVRPRPEGSDPHSLVKASLQRGAPKPRPLLPVPAALRGVDKPWMQQELSLQFDAPATAESAAQPAQSFALKMTQWTGMEEIGWQPPRRQRPAQKPLAETEAAAPADPTATPAVATEDALAEADASEPAAADANAEESAWVDEPALTPEEEAAENELRAQAEAGSGTIVWDAALHLAHWIHASPSQRVRGPILELGAGTGALGLSVQKILALQAGGAADPRAVLTDGGKVLELLQKNVANNASDGEWGVREWCAMQGAWQAMR